MQTASKEAKRHELWDLRHKDPAKLIATYRRVTDMEVDETLPMGITFDSIIETIVHSGRDPLEKRPSNRPWR
jgi:hypothetical protein